MSATVTASRKSSVIPSNTDVGDNRAEPLLLPNHAAFGPGKIDPDKALAHIKKDGRFRVTATMLGNTKKPLEPGVVPQGGYEFGEVVEIKDTDFNDHQLRRFLEFEAIEPHFDRPNIYVA